MPGRHEPLYLELYRTGELARRAARAVERLHACDLCPHRCLAARSEDERGTCRTGRLARVVSAGPHFGEEAPLVGRGGSGTIFFSSCNLSCVFCQNADISQGGCGPELSTTELAEVMVRLQAQSCQNINLVSPTHVLAQFLEALLEAVPRGLCLPIVYNSGGYDAVDALALLDRVVDIYMPDLKYADEDTARRLSGPADYVERNRAAVREMHRQVGDLQLDEEGVAWRGLLVRHLVLPSGLAGTAAVMAFLAREISPDTHVNVMDQYRPCHQAWHHPGLERPLTREEYSQAVQAAWAAGLWRLHGVGCGPSRPEP